MRSKTYRAKTMKEALSRVRRDLGGDAVILASREIRRRRLFGLGPRALVEVTATDTMPPEVAIGARSNPEPVGTSIAPDTRILAPTSAGLQARFGEELSRLHAMVETLSRHGRIDHLVPDLPIPLIPTYSQLIEADVSEVLARRLIQHVAECLETRSTRRSRIDSRDPSRRDRTVYSHRATHSGRRRYAPSGGAGGADRRR